MEPLFTEVILSKPEEEVNQLKEPVNYNASRLIGNLDEEANHEKNIEQSRNSREDGDESNVQNPDTIFQSHLTLTHKFMLAGTISLTYFLTSFTVGSGLLIIPVMADYFEVSVLAVQWVTSAFQFGLCESSNSSPTSIRLGF
ncbi:uncharacterized protein I206_103661 [Kwoniella pini CBS 10737]|uniref:Uncharacterized protein n=1 Tax=Kwoniella pini CBS 10737 TaxID=1296096 RepID=A0AAJ8L514_9TREE